MNYTDIKEKFSKGFYKGTSISNTFSEDLKRAITDKHDFNTLEVSHILEQAILNTDEKDINSFIDYIEGFADNYAYKKEYEHPHQ